MKTDLFQSCGHCWVFQICWHIECSTFAASSFRIWNSSTGIPSPPLALFILMLSKAHLTSHSRMSGSRWVIAPSWLSGSWRFFLYSSSVYSCHLFLISSTLLGPYNFCPLSSPSLHEMFLGISNFLEEISILSHSVVFLYFFALIAEEGFLISPAILWNSAFRCLYLSFSPLLFASLLSQLFVRPPQTAILLFCISFPWAWSWSLSPVQCHEPLSNLRWFSLMLPAVNSVMHLGLVSLWGTPSQEFTLQGWLLSLWSILIKKIHSRIAD